MQISIAGAGIGGLAAAALLGAQGHEVKVYDQFGHPRPIGSGLVIQPVGMMVLAAMGALAEAQALGTSLRRMLGHEVSGRRMLDVRYDPGGTGRHGLAIHRGALFGVLLDAARGAGVILHPASRVTGRDASRLTFQDGSRSDPADLLIDALGAQSPLSPLQGRPLPYGAIWGTVDWPVTDLPADELRQIYSAANRMIGVLPIGGCPATPGPKRRYSGPCRRSPMRSG